MIAALLGIIGLWCGADFTYATIVEHKLAKWEATIKRDANGVREGCQEFSVGSGKTALLMVHGFGDSPQVWEYMAPYLAGKGYTCRAIRLPGFASAIEVYRATDRQQWTAKVRQELADLRQTHDSVFIIAHSLGCACSINVLIDDPEAADGLVAIAPLIAVSNQRAPILTSRQWFKVLTRLQPFSRIIASAYEPNIHNTEELKLVKVDRFTPQEVFREMFALLEHNETRSAMFSTPLLMVVTDKDMVVDTKKTEAFYEAVSSTEKELVHNNKAGHLMPRDYGWQDIADDADRFIQKQLAE